MSDQLTLAVWVLNDYTTSHEVKTPSPISSSPIFTHSTSLFDPTRPPNSRTHLTPQLRPLQNEEETKVLPLYIPTSPPCYSLPAQQSTSYSREQGAFQILHFRCHHTHSTRPLSRPPLKQGVPATLSPDSTPSAPLLPSCFLLLPDDNFRGATVVNAKAGEEARKAV
jgi:hypothetical protein